MGTKFFGQGERLRRSDLLLIRQAIAGGWDVPQETKVAILRDVMALFDDGAAGVRLWCAAAQTVIAMVGDNQLRDHHDRELRGYVETCRRWLAANLQLKSKRKPTRLTRAAFEQTEKEIS